RPRPNRARGHERHTCQIGCLTWIEPTTTMKVLTVVGARPQFIKAMPVSRVLRTKHQEVLVHTGQHYDDTMSDVFFRELALPAPDHNLGVGSGSHAEQTGRMMIELEPVMADERPDRVIVYGDTNSTLAEIGRASCREGGEAAVC